MKPLFFCLLLISLGAMSLRSADIPGVAQTLSIEMPTGDPIKGPKTAKQKKQKVKTPEICKRPQIKKRNMGNTGAMRNRYASKLVRLNK